MGKYEKLLRQVVEGGSDANIGFDDLCILLSRMGWSERIRGSHHVFSKSGMEAQLNLQRQGEQRQGLSSEASAPRHLAARFGAER